MAPVDFGVKVLLSTVDRVHGEDGADEEAAATKTTNTNPHPMVLAQHPPTERTLKAGPERDLHMAMEVVMGMDTMEHEAVVIRDEGEADGVAVVARDSI